jgi:hypothetical protein
VSPVVAFAVVAQLENVKPVFARFPTPESVNGVVGLYVQVSLAIEDDPDVAPFEL